MPIQVLAVPADLPGLDGHDLDQYAAAFTAAATKRQYLPIVGYRQVDAIFDGIDQFLKGHTDGDCLRLLEIEAHGNTQICDGIGIEDGTDLRRGVAHVAARLAALDLCAKVDVYLSSCNTGLGAPSIASRLADALPRFHPTAFPHHVTVWGTRGYFSGTHMVGDAHTDDVVWGKLTPRQADYPKYAGAVRASGDACYAPFRNTP